MMDKAEILVVDDHPVIALAVKLLLKTKAPNALSTHVEGGKEALKILKQKSFDLIILDVNLPDYNILNLLPNIFSIRPKARILIFTMTPENILARRLFSMNVMGFLSKGVSDDEIFKAITTVLSGKKYISADFSDVVVQDFLSGNTEVNPFNELSDREYQILMELLVGKSTKEVSEKLHLHGSSVSTYRLRIYQKLEVDNYIELYKKAKLFKVIS